jgi:hypothetical protein
MPHRAHVLLTVAIVFALGASALGGSARGFQRGTTTRPPVGPETPGGVQHLTVVRGTLTGTVRDQARALVPKIEVRLYLESVATVPPHRTLTDQEGRFRFTGLPLGSYCLSINGPGAGVTVRTGIQVKGAQETNVPVVLGQRPPATPADTPRRRSCT